MTSLKHFLIIIIIMTAVTLKTAGQEQYKTLYDFKVKSISG
jgi:hypothetical protein